MIASAIPKTDDGQILQYKIPSYPFVVSYRRRQYSENTWKSIWQCVPVDKYHSNQSTDTAALRRCQSGFWSRPRDLTKAPQDRRKDTTASGGDSIARGEVLPPSDWVPARQYRAGVAAPHWSPPDSRLLPGRKTPWRERHTHRVSPTSKPRCLFVSCSFGRIALGQILTLLHLSSDTASRMHIVMCTAFQKPFVLAIASLIQW